MVVHVFDTMGTTASIVTTALMESALSRALEQTCIDFDRRFSLYQPDSEASRLNRHEVLLRDASPQMRDAYHLAIAWRKQTEGAFTPIRPDNSTDLAGVVKALAIRRCGELLIEAGLTDWCVNIGGDVLIDGNDTIAGHPWVVGIVDPTDRARLISQAICAGKLRSVCTSGTSERGDHVWRATAREDFRQVTVVAADVVEADVLATAILAGGEPTLELATNRWDIEVLAVGYDGRLWATELFRA